MELTDNSVLVNNKAENLKLNILDLAWLVFFVVMYNFYTSTYLQLGVQIFIILCTAYYFVRNYYSFTKADYKRVALVALWLGAFTLWVWLSKSWAVFEPKDFPNTSVAVLRVFVIGVCLAVYCRNAESLKRLIKVLIYSTVIFCLLCIVSNPTSNWGKEEFLSFDGGHMRNGIANFALFAFIFSIIFRKDFNSYILKGCLAVFIITVIICGSRRAILLMLIFMLLYIFTLPSRRKSFEIFLIVAVLAVLVFILLYNIDYIKEIFIDRILDMFSGEESTDGSTVARSFFVTHGWEMFLEKPLTGWGVDGFYNHLEYYTTFDGLYSHNNFIEMLSCFGIVGFVMYYWMYFYCIIKCIKNIKTNPYAKLILITLAVMLIGDYGSISFTAHFSMYFLTLAVIVTSMFVKNKRKKSTL